MGRFAPTFSDEQKQELCRLVREDQWSIVQAAEKIGMSGDYARQLVQADYINNPNPLDATNPIGDMASRLIDAVNAELTALERSINPNNKLKFDIARAGQVAKVLLDLDKLRKANMPVEKAEVDESPLAGLLPASGNGGKVQA